MGHAIFQDILIIFILAIPVVLFVHFIRLPSIIGFLATGAIVGPYGVGFIQNRAEIDVLAELGVTLLLFTVGMEFSFSALKKLKQKSFLAAVLQMGGTILVGMALGRLLGWSPYSGLYFGCVLALSSTAIVISTLYYQKMIDSLAGQLSTAILILQDLALIPMIIILPLFAMTQTMPAETGTLLREAGQSFVVIVVVAILGRLLAAKILHQIFRSRSRELFVVTIIVIALGMAWFTHILGFSPALGAFLGGMIIGGSEFKYQALSEISPFRFCFNSLFFVSIGMLFNFEFAWEHFALVSLFILLIPSLKMFVTVLGTLAVGIPLRIALVVGISLAEIGEFSFLLAYAGQKTGAITPFLYELVVTAAVFSMLMTPLMVLQAPRLANWLVRLPILRRFAKREQEQQAQSATERLSNHIIICGFGPLGQALGRILKEHHVPYIILELNPETITQIRQREEPVFFGDGASEDILYRCGIERARMLAITVPDFFNSAAIIQQARKLNPDIRIITRSKYRNEVSKLYDAGADIVVSEELEGGIEMGRYALYEVGIAPETVDAYIEKVREFGSADFF